ncbi:MAG: glycosyltransferase family 2 protein [Bacteroidales bacterium]|nr:glycosyltransferase family 2 protein [Bacteroidales bacterium]
MEYIKKNTEPLVSIITVNYNQIDVTMDLLHSLQQVSYQNVEIIVVDNNSKNDSFSLLKKEFPNVLLVKSNINRGFAGGNNLGLHFAKGKYILFLNNDVVVTKGFIEPMVRLLESDSRIGMVSPKIRFYYEPETIQYAGYTSMNKITLRQNLIGYKQKDEGQFDTVQPSYSVHGAAMMVPAQILYRVGLMAEIYFLYYEEHDWSFRIKKAGFKVYYQPKSLVFHKESVSTGKNSPLKIYYITRNRILYARRNYKGLIFLLNILYLLLIASPKNALLYLLQARVDLFTALLKGVFWNITHFKGIHYNPKI